MNNPFRKKTKEEDYLNSLNITPEAKSQARGAFSRLASDYYDNIEDKEKDLSIVRDITILGIGGLGLGGESNQSKMFLGGAPGNPVGYQAGGSILKKIMPNDFTRQAFLAEAYWACRKSRNELIVQKARDGYNLTTTEGSVSKKQIKLINNVLIDLGVPKKRLSMSDTLLWCGTQVMNNSYNRQGGLLYLNPLLMANIAPRWDATGQNILGWDCDLGNGNKQQFIPIDDTDVIKTFNARSHVLGVSCLASVEVDIEAALQGSIYNNNVMAKGGLLSVIVRMKNALDGTIVNDRNSFKLADELTKWLERRFGGIRGAGQLAFIPGTDGVDVLNKVSEMDGAWGKLDASVGTKVSLLHGLSPERIGLPMTSQYENKMMITNTMALSFDNNSWYYQSEVDNYITEEVIKNGLGIDNVRLESAGKFSSISLVAAEVGDLIANMGVDIVTVDEFRVDYLHVNPVGGELGKKYLGEFLRKEDVIKGGPAVDKALGMGKFLFPEYAQNYMSLEKHHSDFIKYY